MSYKGMPSPWPAGRPKGSKDGVVTNRKNSRNQALLVVELDAAVRRNGFDGLGDWLFQWALKSPENEALLAAIVMRVRLPQDIDPVDERLKREEIAAAAGQAGGPAGSGGGTVINIATQALAPTEGMRTPETIDAKVIPVLSVLPSVVDIEGSLSDLSTVRDQDL